MMATVPHVTSGLGLRKFQADGFLLTRVYTVFLSALLLGVFAKSRKATISLIMSVRLPIHSSARDNWTDFHEI